MALVPTTGATITVTDSAGKAMASQMGTVPASLLDGAANPDYSAAYYVATITVTFPNAVSIQAYRVIASYRYAGQYAPRAWKLRASNDGTTWTTLDTRSGLAVWGGSESRTFTLNEPSAMFTRFQFENMSTMSGDAYLWLGDLGFYESDGTLPSQRPLSGWGIRL